MVDSFRAVENLVIGGGLAGAMAAIRLAAAGREVLLLEKESLAHHKVCGEFLSPEAVSYLGRAGVDPQQLGARPIRYLSLSVKQRSMQTELPFRAWSISRCVLDAALLQRAECLGCAVRRGIAVQGLSRNDNGWKVELPEGTAQSARTVFLATGKHDLRGWKRSPSIQGDLVGFKLHWRLTEAQTEALRGFMDLFLFSGGYGGLALVEGDAANLCLVVKRARLRTLGGWVQLLAQLEAENRHMSERLSGAHPLWASPLAISSIPYGYMSHRDRGLWPVGDQAAVIPSFTGDGMAIALHSGALAAEMYLSGASAGEYQQKLRSQLRKSMHLATLLSRVMVTSSGRALASHSLPLLPGAIQWIAGSTRIPDSALRTAHSR